MTSPNGRRVVTSTQTPILRVEGVLIASIQQSLDDDAVLAFEQALLERVATEGAAGVVIDITAVDVVDSFMARSLNDMAAAVALLGTRLAIVGIQPAAAITLVKMGFTIPAALTALDLEQGLRLLRQSTAAAVAEPVGASPGAVDE